MDGRWDVSRNKGTSSAHITQPVPENAATYKILGKVSKSRKGKREERDA